MQTHKAKRVEIIIEAPMEGRLTAALATGAQGRADAVVIISADASAPHQAVVNVLDAARRAGLPRLTFAAQGQGASVR